MSPINQVIKFVQFTVILALGGLISCRKDPYSITESYQITVQWHQAYADETMKEVRTGLHWALSSIGAVYLDENVVQQVGDDRFMISTADLGLNNSSERSLNQLHTVLKTTEEYRLKGAVDVGRYISLLLGASAHYYALVDMPENLTSLLAGYSTHEKQGYVNASGVSSKDRIISFSDQKGLNQLFVAQEIDPLTHEILEYETLDIMTNGQLRFGIFNAAGQRINGTNPFVSSAGKPAKCMWCHEANIQPLIEVQFDFEGYLTGLELEDTLNYFRAQHGDLQHAIEGGVDFSNKQAHTKMELLYISFMEPNAQRLALEWNMPVDEVLLKLAHLTTHIHDEFPFLGTLYDRNEVDAFAPFQSAGVSTSVREASEVEVDYINE